MRVLILHDEVRAAARPDELDTLVQVDAVAAALAAAGMDVARLAFGADLAALAEGVRAAAPDVVFNLVESVLGEGRLIHLAPSLLEALAVPFTGAGSAAMLLSSGKLLAKRVLAAHGLPTPAWHTPGELRAGADLGARRRWLAKSVWEHGSLGLEADSVLAPASAEELADEVERRIAELGGEAFAEEYVHGREFNAALLAGPDGPECLPIPEIRFPGLAPDDPRVVGYRAKWAPDSREWDATPRSFARDARDERLHARLRELALAAWDAFDLEGAARVDFRVGEDGEPQVIDVNANPCLSPDAGFAATLERAGIRYADALARILEAGLARHARTRRALDVPHPADLR